MHGYADLLKPAVVTHLRVLHVSDGPLLFVVRGNTLLQAYGELDSSELRWIVEFPLYGELASLEVVKGLLVAVFKPARIAVLRWNAENLSLDTVSLHFYERLMGNFDTQRPCRVIAQNTGVFFWFQREHATFVAPAPPNPVTGEPEGEWTTTLVGIPELSAALKISNLEDFCYLPNYIEPTLGVLATVVPTWIGLVGTDGRRTKTFIVANGVNNWGELLRVDVDCQYSRVMSLNDPKRHVLLMGNNNLAFVGTDGTFLQLEQSYRFENCLAEQNGGYIYIVLEYGMVLLLDIAKAQIFELGVEVQYPMSLYISDNRLYISTRAGPLRIFDIEFGSKGVNGIKEDTQNSETSNVEVAKSLASLYSDIQVNECSLPKLLPRSGLNSYGTFTSVATIDNGLACATLNGVLIVERGLPFDELDVFEDAPNPGEFWLAGERLIVLAVHQESEQKKRKSDRLKLEDLKSKRQVQHLPKGLSATEPPLAVLADSKGYIFVQPNVITVLDSKWRVIKAMEINASRAEIRGRLVLVENENDVVIYNDDLEIVRNVAAPATISKHLVISYRGNFLDVIADDNDFHFDMSDLPERAETAKDAKKETSESELVSVYALEFCGSNYVGVHKERIFAIYELRGSSLVKRFTVPFRVNASPIYLPHNELLVFPGRRSHAVVKGPQSSFACQPLSLDGDLVDITEYESTIAWRDSEAQLHFTKFDAGVDHLSYELPVRYIELPEDMETMEIAYHDELAAVIVGANSLNYQTGVVSAAVGESKEDGDDEEMQGAEDEQDKVEPDEENNGEEELRASRDAKEVEDFNEETAKYRGAVYILSLTSYEFQPVMVTYEEILLSLQLVDLEKEQVLAVGSALDAQELEETNGHIRLYHVKDNGRSHGSYIEISEYACELVRGAVSSMTAIMGFLAVAHGQQIHVYDFAKGLVPVGFYDTQVYMQDLKCARNILVLGERLRPLRLVNFALQPRRLDLLAVADPLPAGSEASPTAAVEVVSSYVKGDLAVVTATRDKRLQLFRYDPESPESLGGQRLVPYSSFFVGRSCVGMASVQYYTNSDLAAYGVNTDGSLFVVKPLAEDTFRTMFLLTQQMVDKETNTAGQNIRMYRAYELPRGSFGTDAQNEGPSSHHLIDVTFAQRFWSLNGERQTMYAKKLGYEGLERVQRALSTEGRDPLKL